MLPSGKYLLQEFPILFRVIRLFYGMIQERVGMYDFQTSHGKEVMMKTPLNNYFILFKERELDEFSEMLTQAYLLIESYKGVRNHN